MMESVPTWTLAFNIAALPGLAYSLPAADNTIETVKSIVASELVGFGILNATSAGIETSLELTHQETETGTNNGLFLAPIIGVSQIFVVNNPWSGALFLFAIALESRCMALAAFGGSCVGCICGAYVQGPIGIGDGLWGFNSSLAALAVSVFYVPTWGAVGIAVSGKAQSRSFAYNAAIFIQLRTSQLLFFYRFNPLPTRIYCGCYPICWNGHCDEHGVFDTVPHSTVLHRCDGVPSIVE